jgi:hypothetical protein
MRTWIIEVHTRKSKRGKWASGTQTIFAVRDFRRKDRRVLLSSPRKIGNSGSADGLSTCGSSRECREADNRNRAHTINAKVNTICGGYCTKAATPHYET